MALRTNVGDYTAAIEPDLDFFRDWYALAEKVGGTVGLTSDGNLMITLPADGPRADVVAAGIDNADFPHCYVAAGCDSTLEPVL